MAEVVSSPGVVNEKEKRNLHHSTFPLKQVKYTTEQFGYIKPHYYADGVADDSLPVRSDIRTTSYTLKAPLMQDVFRRMSYFKVDYPAILPINFDKIFTNPVVGGDVPQDANCVIENGYSKLFEKFNSILSRLMVENFRSLLTGDATAITNNGLLTSLIQVLIVMENFYSRGSLLSSLGCHLSRQITFGNFSIGSTRYRGRSFDQLFDDFMAMIAGAVAKNGKVYFTYGRNEYKPDTDSINANGYKQLYFGGPDSDISFATFLDMVRDSPNWMIWNIGESTGGLQIDSELFAVFKANYFEFDGDANEWNFVMSYRGPVTGPFNFARVAAYQLAVAEFFTDDKIDNIYNAALFREYIGTLITNRGQEAGIFNSFADTQGFQLNGVSYQYDWLSGHYLDSMLNRLSFASLDFCTLQYFMSLFGYKRSLRYKDYFVSSRCRPLAVGDVTVNVADSSVSVVDISKNIQVQRFLNRVNHVGRDLRNYIRGIFGVELSPDRHVPHYLADITEMVYTAEVENTGAAQQTEPNSITARFTGNARNKELNIYVDVPCVIIGVTSYDIERLYADGIERQFFVKDRYDMFIPELQFVGDQALYLHELDAGADADFGTPFGYQYRDMQYKLLIPQADGGFVDYLPGYAFLYRNQMYNPLNINSNFIRAIPSELDEFYLSLTGFSLASRFHFISRIENYVNASRPMIANPKILE